MTSVGLQASSLLFSLRPQADYLGSEYFQLIQRYNLPSYCELPDHMTFHIFKKLQSELTTKIAEMLERVSMPTHPYFSTRFMQNNNLKERNKQLNKYNTNSTKLFRNTYLDFFTYYFLFFIYHIILVCIYSMDLFLHLSTHILINLVN